MAILKFDGGWGEDEKRIVACFFSQVGFEENWTWMLSKKYRVLMLSLLSYKAKKKRKN